MAAPFFSVQSESPEERFENELREIVSISSGSNNEEGLNRIARVIRTKLEDRGFAVSWNYSDRSLIALRGQAAPQLKNILLVGHMDTVQKTGEDTLSLSKISDSDLTAKNYQKFAPAFRGTGVADAKAGIISLLNLIDAFDATNDRDKLRWKIFIAADEEIASRYSQSALKKFAEGVDLAFIFEPAWFDARSGRSIYTKAHGGNLYLNIEIETSPEHPATSVNRGLGASDKIAQVLPLLAKLREKKLAVNIVRVHGETKANVTSSTAEVKAAIRYLKKSDLKLIESAIEEIKRLETDDVKINIMRDIRWQPQKTLSDDWIKKIKDAVKNEGHKAPLFKTSLTRSSASFLADQGILTIDGMGPFGLNLHSPEETLLLGSAQLQKNIQCSLILSLLRARP